MKAINCSNKVSAFAATRLFQRAQAYWNFFETVSLASYKQNNCTCRGNSLTRRRGRAVERGQEFAVTGCIRDRLERVRKPRLHLAYAVDTDVALLEPEVAVGDRLTGQAGEWPRLLTKGTAGEPIELGKGVERSVTVARRHGLRVIVGGAAGERWG